MNITINNAKQSATPKFITISRQIIEDQEFLKVTDYQLAGYGVLSMPATEVVSYEWLVAQLAQFEVKEAANFIPNCGAY